MSGLDGWLSGLKRRLAKPFGALSRAGSNPAPSVDLDAVMAQFEARELRRLEPRPARQRRTKPRSRAGVCPTPGKVRYGSLEAARGSRGWKANKGTRMHAYRCSCGGYHLARSEAA